MSNHPTTRSSTTTTNDFNETMKKTPSPRRQTTRSTSNLNKDLASSMNTNEQSIQVIKPVAVRPPSTDSSQNPYNLRSRSKLKKTPHLPQKPVPPLTRAAAASAGVKIDSILSDDLVKTNRSSTTRKRKASEDDHRPYLDLLKMKQTQSTYSFDGNSPKKMTRRADQDCIGVEDDDSGCDYDSPAHSPVDFTDVPPGHVFQYEESNMSYDSGFSTGSGEPNPQQTHPPSSSSLSHSQTSALNFNSGIITRSSANHCSKFSAALDLDVNAIEGDLGF